MSFPQPDTKGSTAAVPGILGLLLAACLALPAFAQEQSEPSIISIYHIAPGKQLEFLRWHAAREAIDAEAGLPATQWYAHMDGDSWDYVSITPTADDALFEKADALARQKGLKAGAAAGLEHRTMVMSHTDTYSAGPMTAAELVKRVTTP